MLIRIYADDALRIANVYELKDKVDFHTAAVTGDVSGLADTPDKAIAALSEGFSQHLDQPVQIQIVQGEPATATPAQIEQQRYAQLLAQAQQDLAQDPHIQFLIQRFGAQLDADSILPLKH